MAVTLVRSAGPSALPSSNQAAVSATLSATPTAGNILWFCAAADKNVGAITKPAGFTAVASQSSTSVSYWFGYKISAGTETTATLSFGAAAASGATCWYGEFADGGSGAWTIVGSASHDTDETSVLSWSSGTTAATSAAGAGIAMVATDSGASFTTPTGSWTNGYTSQRAWGDGGTIGGAGEVAVATKLSVAAGTAATTTFTPTGPGSDQMAGAIAVFGRASSSTAPGAPTSLAATRGNTQATVTWTAPASNGGSAILDYTVTSSSGGPTPPPSGTAVTDTGITGPAYSHSGLVPGVVYNVRVRSVGPNGTSADSAAVVFTTTAAAGNSSVTVAGTPATVTGLTNGTAYTFTATARNAIGSSAASAASNSVTPATTPGVPTGVGATAGNASATVSWTAPASNGGSAVIDYTVTSSPGGLTATTAGTTVSVAGLTNGTAYVFTVKSRNAVGSSAASTASSSVTPTTGVVAPGAPTAVTATAGNTQATVSWTAPGSNGGSAIIDYTVTSSPGGLTATTVGTSATVTGLTNGTAYTFTVKARNTAGSSVASAASAVVTPMTVPGAPTGVAAAAGNASATVTWTAPASNGGSAIIDYTVTSSPGAKTATVTGTTATVTGLTNSTAYTFTVKARNTVGSSAASAASAAVTPSTGVVAPGAPTAVAATAGAGQAVVTWSAPSSNGGGTILDYTVTSSPDGITTTVTGLTSTVTGLTNGTPYTFTVKARNSAGQGLPSAASAPATPGTVPGVPTAVSAVAGNTSADVAWSAPGSDGGSPIIDYTVTASPGGSTVTVFGRTATVTGLTNGTAYTLTVSARNSTGVGTASAPTASVTPSAMAIPPSTPTGRYVIAHVSGGSYEPTRADAGSFTGTIKGSAVSGGATGELWLDIRNLAILVPIMAARADTVAAAGFNAIAWNRLNGYSTTTGFPLSAADQLAWNRLLARLAHERGLACFLRNDGAQAATLVSDYEGVIVDGAYAASAVNSYLPFSDAGKPVFAAEYTGTVDCADANSRGWSLIRVPTGLGSARLASCVTTPPPRVSLQGSIGPRGGSAATTTHSVAFTGLPYGTPYGFVVWSGNTDGTTYSGVATTRTGTAPPSASNGPAWPSGASLTPRTAARVDQFGNWRSWPVTRVLSNAAADSWANAMLPTARLGELGGSGYAGKMVYGVPLIPADGVSTLAQAAAGAYDTQYRQAALNLVAAGQAGAETVIRLGWEFNGTWQPWSAGIGGAGTYINAWKRAVDAMRGVAGFQARFWWCPALGAQQFAAEDAYPGDAYVDFVGPSLLDHSWITNYTDSSARWADILNGDHGLAFWIGFVRSHSKQLSIEWALSKRPDGHGGGDNPAFVTNVFGWLAANTADVGFEVYREYDDPDAEHLLEGTTFPLAAAAYRSAFSTAQAPSAPAPAPTLTVDITTSSVPSGAVLFDSNFNSGNLNSYSSVVNPNRVTLMNDPVLGAARKVVKIDCYESDNQLTGNPRVQLETAQFLKNGDDIFIGVAMMFPSSWPDGPLPGTGWITLGEIYGPPFNGGSPLNIGMAGPEAGISSMTHPPNTPWQVAYSIPIVHNVWMDFVVHEKLSTGSDGFFEIHSNTGSGWRQVPVNGQMRYSMITLTDANNGGPNYYKIASYREAGMYNLLTNYFADHRIGTTFAAAAPTSYGASGGGGGTSSGATLHWTGSTGADGYYVLRNGVQVRDVNALTFQDGSYVAGTTYQVVAHNAAGTAASSVVTPGATNNAPGGVLSGLKGWWRADLIPGSVDGIAVASVPDQSANGYTVTASGSAQPTYRRGGMNSRPALRFSGSNGMTLPNGAMSTLNNASGATIMAACKDTDRTQTRTVINYATASGTNAVRARAGHGTGSPGAYQASGRRLDAESVSTLNGTALDTAAHVETYRYNFSGGRAAITVDGVQNVESAFGTSGNTSATNSAGASIGRAPDGTQGWIGYISEVVVWNRALSAPEQQAAETELSARWNVGKSIAGAPAISGSTIAGGPAAPSVTNAIPAGSAIGDTLVWVLGNNAQVTYALPGAGWTSQQYRGLTIAWKTVTVDTTTGTLTATHSDGQYHIASGVLMLVTGAANGPGAIEATSAYANGSASPATAPGVTATDDGRLVIGGYLATGLVPPMTFTTAAGAADVAIVDQVDADYLSIAVTSETTRTGDSGPTSVTMSKAASWSAFQVAIRPVPAAAESGSTLAGFTAGFTAIAPTGGVQVAQSFAIAGPVAAVTVTTPAGDVPLPLSVPGALSMFSAVALPGDVTVGVVVAGNTCSVAMTTIVGIVTATAPIGVEGLLALYTVQAPTGVVPVAGVVAGPPVPANVAEIVVATFARVYMAPATARPPVDASAAMDPEWRQVGLFVRDSLLITDGRNVVNLAAFDVDGGGLVVPTSSFATLSVDLQQWNAANFAAIVGGGGAVQIAPGQFRWNPTISVARDVVSVIAEVIDNYRRFRFVFPRCAVDGDSIELAMRKAKETVLPLRLKTLRARGGVPPYYVLSTDPSFSGS